MYHVMDNYTRIQDSPWYKLLLLKNIDEEDKTLDIYSVGSIDIELFEQGFRFEPIEYEGKTYSVVSASSMSASFLCHDFPTHNRIYERMKSQFRSYFSSFV